MNALTYYEHPGEVSGTVFDPSDYTFGPIMRAIQSGDYEEARDRLDEMCNPSMEADLQRMHEEALDAEDKIHSAKRALEDVIRCAESALEDLPS